jgi:sterol desaturase/sphingolipid hydroxylase (fatty acid hydroxylase superfamily)
VERFSIFIFRKPEFYWHYVWSGSLKNTSMQNKEIRLFKSELLEDLSHTTPFITAAFYSLMILTFLLAAFQFTTLLIWDAFWVFISGLFAWTLIEYVLHRFLFHVNHYFPALQRFHFVLHGVHHEQPHNKERLFMPPLPGMIIALFLFVFWFLLIGINALLLMAGICTGYLIYAFIHYSLHSKPTGFLLGKLWLHHALHHYRYPNKAFGVTSPVWDIVFGTMPPRSEKQNISKAQVK